ncbi:MAG: hypothetical protein EA425_07270 [Puniceicoccaceae bacterium]|nr:MAG: hypothetical protein EA425_07270 [Puniceicoccaceae bacterium]
MDASPAPAGSWCAIDDERCYQIDHTQALPPFLINLVTASDLWMFVASNGALTAGRGSAEGALFPYQTVDRIYDSIGHAGPFTLLEVATPTDAYLWEPFSADVSSDPAIVRRLTKSTTGNRLWFEEVHTRLGLTFRYGWASADALGWVRTCELANTGEKTLNVRVLDGLRNLLPAGIPQRIEAASSNLADAYKTSELQSPGTLAVYALAAGITDHPVPLESLRASIAWSRGLPGATILLSDRQVPDWRAGRQPVPETHCRGLRGAYLLTATIALAPGGRESWLIVADTGLDQTSVLHRIQNLDTTDPEAACRRSTAALRTLIGAADGAQAGGEETVAAHHWANVLFNVLRGGAFLDGPNIPGADFAAHAARHNRAAAARHAPTLQSLPETLHRDDLLARIEALADPDLARIAAEYLPLRFSRRHGDPSRPWNQFSIRLRDSRGRRLLAYEGNWRDIFQNWEALCLSCPAFFEAVIAKFLNASTADGFNPYRISQEGIDWEVPDPGDPWSSIGYWGDHQVIYLLKLLEWSSRHRPDGLPRTLRERRYAYANVPYRITGYAAMRNDPRSTIVFDRELDHAIRRRLPGIGADARLLADREGRVLHVSLAEKLLVLVLNRLTHFIPGGGIWMNTQRPEWNDANNALVGYGVSVVTLAYLRRFLDHLRRVFAPALGTPPLRLSGPLAELARTARRTLDQADPKDPDPGRRRELVDALATAGECYRSRVYDGGMEESDDLDPAEVIRLLDLALNFVDQSLLANRRPDHLFHAYNQLEFSETPPGLSLHRLPLMLEGQVAVLSSGLLTPAETVALLEGLRRSPLHRADQNSYLLYPDRTLPGFLERNRIPAERVAASALLAALAKAGDDRLIVQDPAGCHRFHPDLVSGEALAARLDELAAEPRWADLVHASREEVQACYEAVFRHRAFTGRSGSMFGFEGLGCIYWHMVAKLLLAIQESLFTAADKAAPEVPRLTELYYDVRTGLGFNKSPAAYGAFPTDPYSHTPGHAGAQQPGMTGQVKEEILTRFGELGVRIENGCLGFRPFLLRASEFSPNAIPFPVFGRGETSGAMEIPPASLGFTYCSVPVIYRLGSGPASLLVDQAKGNTAMIPGSVLPAEFSARVFARDGSIRRIEANLGGDYTPLP